MTLTCPIHDNQQVDDRGRGCKECARLRRQVEKRWRAKHQQHRPTKRQGSS